MSNTYYKSCTKCGRPQTICKGECCNKTGCQCKEYGCKHKACIRVKDPDCPYEAVIPMVTVENIDNIKGLADCFVHVSSINTTFYIDDKHRIMTTWSGLVSVSGYDYDANPLNLRNQIAYDEVAGEVAIYNGRGQYEIMQTSDTDKDYNLLNHRPKINGVTLEGSLSLDDLGIQSITNAEIDEIMEE